MLLLGAIAASMPGLLGCGWRSMGWCVACPNWPRSQEADPAAAVAGAAGLTAARSIAPLLDRTRRVVFEPACQCAAVSCRRPFGGPRNQCGAGRKPEVRCCHLLRPASLGRFAANAFAAQRWFRRLQAAAASAPAAGAFGNQRTGLLATPLKRQPWPLSWAARVMELGGLTVTFPPSGSAHQDWPAPGEPEAALPRGSRNAPPGSTKQAVESDSSTGERRLEDRPQ